MSHTTQHMQPPLSMQDCSGRKFSCRYREYQLGVHQDADRPRDRSRRHADRADPKERAAGNPLAATSKSFAMEAAARNAAPQHADPEHTSRSELPPPPSRPTSAAQV